MKKILNTQIREKLTNRKIIKIYRNKDIKTLNILCEDFYSITIPYAK